MSNLRLHEPILNVEGEVIRQLWPTKKRLRQDFEWLSSIGHTRIQSRFRQLERFGEKDIQPDQRATNVLKRSSYVVGAQLASKNMTERIEFYLTDAVQADLKVHGAAPSARDNPFFWSLHLIMSGQKWLSNDQKSKSARQLLYAYRHGVPPELLTGFLLQTGTSNATARSSDPEHREAWYDASRTNEWILRLKKPR